MMPLLAIDRVAFYLGPIAVMWYAVIIVSGIILADFMFRREGKLKGFDEEQLMDIEFWAIVIGFIGARIYYVIFNWAYYSQNLDQIIAIRSGGMAIYGGIIAACIVIYYFARKYKLDIMLLLDVAAPALMLAQAIGRWANFINQEAHGPEIARSTLEAWYLPNWFIEQMNINGIYYHPTFLYESLWLFIGLVFVLIFRRILNTFYKGEITAFYAMWYGLGRMVIEGLRTDSLYLGSLRVSQWVSGILFIFGLGYIIYQRWLNKNKPPYYSDYEPIPTSKS